MAYTKLLTVDFFRKEYLSVERSLPKLQVWLRTQGYNVHYNTLCRYVRKYGMVRSLSKTRRINVNSPADEITLTEKHIEALDGFLLGDGHISVKRNKVKSARLSCSTQHEEFCNYLLDPFRKFGVNISPYHRKTDDKKYWQGRTRMHSEFYDQWARWYTVLDGKKTKRVPKDVRITPDSMRRWHLGDGSLCRSTHRVRLASYAFSNEEIEMLMAKMKECGIIAVRYKKVICIKRKDLPCFFEFVGHDSPIRCYAYKFKES